MAEKENHDIKVRVLIEINGIPAADEQVEFKETCFPHGSSREVTLKQMARRFLEPVITKRQEIERDAIFDKAATVFKQVDPNSDVRLTLNFFGEIK